MGSSPTPNSTTANQTGDGNGNENQNDTGAEDGDGDHKENGNGYQNGAGTGAENGDGNQNGTGTGNERPKEKVNDVRAVKALVTSWKPYLLWYMLEVGTPASASYVDIAKSTAFSALYAKEVRLGAVRAVGGAESGGLE